MIMVDMVKILVEELQKLLATGNLIGKPMDFEDKIIIPIARLGFGFGLGSAEEKRVVREASEGAGSGAGAGGGVGPVAAIVIFKGIAGPEGIKVLRLGIGGIGSTMAEALSGFAGMFKEKKEGKAE